MANEIALWNWLKGARRPLGQSLDLERIENQVGAGTPDVCGCFQGEGFKIELKAARRRPVDPETPIKVHFRPAQIPWINGRLKAGGKVWILLQIGEGSEAKRYLIHGSDAKLVANGLTESQIEKLSHCYPNTTPSLVIMIATDKIKKGSGPSPGPRSSHKGLFGPAV
jgi:hypothetical protein